MFELLIEPEGIETPLAQMKTVAGVQLLIEPEGIETSKLLSF